MKKKMFAIINMIAMMMSIVACGSGNNADNRNATERKLILMKHKKHIAILTTLVLVLTLAIPTNVFAAGSKTTLKVSTIKTMTIGTSKMLSIKSNGTVSCESSNKKVISVSGKTLKAKNTGTAKITITAKKNGCKTVSKKFTVKVTPAKGEITNVKTDTNNVVVTAKALKSITGYQFKYATNSKLDKATVKNSKSNKLTLKTNTNKTYYVTVRGYKKSGNTVLYGSWSEKRTVKITDSKHTHNYTSKVTKQPTCSNEGIKTYTCSCGNSYTEKIAASGHSWKHYDAEYKTVTVTVQEAYDEPTEEVHAICNQCGKDFGSGNAGADAAVWHVAGFDGTDCQNYSSELIRTGTIHHDAVTEQRQELVHAAYDKCTTCGKTK